MKQIQWFPGHMKKTFEEIKENLKLVDIVLELRDARVPLSSENPMLQNIIQNKRHIIIFTKKDLADPSYVEKWSKYFMEQGKTILFYDVHKDNIQKIITTSEEVLAEKFARDYARGMKKRPIKAMIVGVPNVGKSTLINKITTKKAVVVGNKPGVTRIKQWIRIHKNMELLDTPGVLWPKFDDPVVGMKLATIGTIKDTILPTDEVAKYIIDFLIERYPGYLSKRYVMENEISFEKLPYEEILTTIGKKRGMLVDNSEIDFPQVVMLILNEFRDGLFGRVTLDRDFEIGDKSDE
jgi:ribosome biogenesis GTP-binding protein YlqF